MTTHLKRLVAQAKLYKPSDCSVLTEEQWLETFANVIVGECCRKLNTMHRSSYDVHNYYIYAENEIGKHFYEENT